ncbi:hypothetical protein FEP95_05704 [Burkholderia multivorans]|nr:hypothetical protein [Burkholderia multivorans]
MRSHECNGARHTGSSRLSRHRRRGARRCRRVARRRMHDRTVRIHELHVAHRPCARVRGARHAHGPRRVIGRHARLRDRRAGARHVFALAHQMRGRLIAIRGRYGRIARGDERMLADRGGRPIARGTQAAREALPHRRNARRARHHVRIAPLPRIDVLRKARDRLAVHERGRGHGRDRMRRAEIHVRVVHVRHVHGGVHGNPVHDDVPVHAFVVVRTPSAPGRMPRLARSEREPRAAGRGDAADRQRDAPVGPVAAADERDERRRIGGRRADGRRPRHPRPAIVDVGPATVVIGREAPRRVVDPGPAPRRLPDPVAVVIRRPVGRRVVRHPDGAVRRRVAPRAVRVEVLIAGDVARHVAGRHRPVLGRVAARGPPVERVGRRRGRLLRDLQVGAGKHGLLPGGERILAVAAVDRRAAAAHGDRRACAIGRDVDAIIARRRNAEREVRRIDFVRRAGR